MPKLKKNPHFSMLLDHVGHHVVVVYYGEGGKKTAVNVSVECEDCGCVLYDEDRHIDQGR